MDNNSNKNISSNKDMAKLYFNLYVQCMDFKDKKKNKNIDCQPFYNNFEKFTNDYYNNREKIE